MKNKLQIKGLRNKLGWLLCLVAFLVCAQGAWADGNAGGPKGVYLNVNGTEVWYNVYSTTWDFTPTCEGWAFKTAKSFKDKDLGTVTTLKLVGFATIGWASGSTASDDWVSAQLRYKIDNGTEFYYKVGNYGQCEKGAADVVSDCTSGQNRVVGNKSKNVDLLSELTVGVHYLNLKPYDQMLYNNSGGCNSFNDHNNYNELSAAFTVPGYSPTSSSKDFGEIDVNSTESETISLTHYGSITTAEAKIEGTNADQFAVTSVSATSVTVSFSPTSAGSKSATVTVTDAYSKTYELTVSGTGKATCTTPSSVSISGTNSIDLDIAYVKITNLTANAVGSGPYDYNWTITQNPGNGASLSSTSVQNPTATFTKTGTYKFKVGAMCSGAAEYVESSEYTVTVSAPTYKYWIKHPWKDGDDKSWSWKELTFATTGECAWVLSEQYGGSGKGCDVGYTGTSSEPSGGTTWYGSPTVVDSPATGDMCDFKFVPSEKQSAKDGSVTITKQACTAPTLSATRYATRCKNTANSFIATVGITDIGTASCLSEFGVEYSTSSDFTSSTKVAVTPKPTGTCSHDVTLNDLTANTKYYFRAYAQMTSGSYVYSTDVQNDYTKPTPVSSYEGVTSTSVTIKGKYETGGGNLSSVLKLGLQVCPDTGFGNNKKYKNFTNVNSNTECQWTCTGDLALLPNTKYYYRTYIEYTDADGTTKCSNSDKSSTKYFTTNDVFSSVTLNDASVCAGATVTLVKSSTPSDGVTWTFSSSDTSVATVDEYGVVTGVAAGTAQITATAQKTGYDDKDAQCTVTVNALPSAPITHGTSVCIGTSATVTAEVVTQGSTIKWYVDDKTSEVAETGPSYDVTEELNQELTVYAAAIKDGCASTRTAATATPIANMALTSIGASASSICINGTSTITPTGLNLGGNGGSISYSSSDADKATVVSASENKGTVTGVSSSGDTPVRITATVSGGCKAQGSADPTAYVDITVKPNASITSVSLDKSSVCAGTGAQASAVAVLGGGTGAWSSSDDTKATIDADGTITTMAAGAPTFTYTITGGCNNATPSATATTDALTINAVPVITPASSNVTNFQVVDLSSTEDITTWTILNKVDNDSYFVGTTATTASFKGTVGGGDNKTFTIIGKTSNVCQGSANVTVTKDTETCP